MRRKDHDRGYSERGREFDHEDDDRGFGSGSRRGSSGGGGFRGASDLGDERYFGGGRQIGEGYSGGGGFSGSWSDSERGSRSYRDDDRFYGESGGRRISGGRYDRDAEEFGQRGSRRMGRGGESAGNDYSGGGLYGGGLGGYSGGGFQGYDPESHRMPDYRMGRGGSPYEESGYYDERYARGHDRGWLDKAGDEVASWFGDEDAERRRRRDRQEGSYRGRGPKNYTRSDERIKENVSDRLEDHSHIDASDIDIEVTGGEVILTGTVENRHSKRLAEDIAESCSGVKNVENRLRVDPNWHTNRYGNSTSGETSGSTGFAGDTQSRSATNKS